MRLKLPSFKNSYCTYLDLCGHIDSPGEEVLSGFLDGEEWLDMTIRYVAPEGGARLRLFAFATGSHHLHFHLTLALNSHFDTLPPPPATHKRDEIEKKLAPLRDLDIHVRTRAQWRLAPADLQKGRRYPWTPEVRSQFGGLTMTLVGATFEITGGRIELFEWRWVKSKQSKAKQAKDDKRRTMGSRELSMFTVGSIQEVRFNSRYVVTQLEIAESDLRAAILGKPSEVGR